ncbi:MAG: SAM-dependent chlorinase/fluorinase [Rhodospirillaceae bacterium]|nr:SAM-dependent chlorinase/fluorinase [Rhodospirillaceae bacterium]
MIHLFTDFGLAGPYIGQVKTVLARLAFDVPAIDLLSDAPAFNPKASAYMLAAYDSGCGPGDVVVGVVDPGVGSSRAAIVVEADGVWYVGPDNGMFEAVVRQAKTSPRGWEIVWCPPETSNSFHGRDIFAPIAARIASGDTPDSDCEGMYRSLSDDEFRRADWPDDLDEVIYVDRFGNVLSGVRGDSIKETETLCINGAILPRRQTFSDAGPSESFCYLNSNGLMEIAVNMGRADETLGLSVGDQVTIREL